MNNLSMKKIEQRTFGARGHGRWQATLGVALLTVAAACTLNAADDVAEAAPLTYANLHSFGSGRRDGTFPSANLVQGKDGNFYGTTNRGGFNKQGTVFVMTPTGTVTTLYSFEKTEGDVTYPSAALVEASDGNFYGTTSAGGAAGKGTAFVITPAGDFKTLHSFTGKGRQGATPEGGLIQASNGNFYGTTEGGGTSGLGTVFMMKAGGKVTTLHSFVGSDGAQPQAGLIEGTDGDFYGTTYAGGAYGVPYGGAANGFGTVFSMNRAGKLTTLHKFSFNGNDGAYPMGALVEGRNHRFYGTTLRGGDFTDGTIFAFTSAATFKTIHVFNADVDGQDPEVGLVQGSGDEFYGTTDSGAPGEAGAVFAMTPEGSVTVLYVFSNSGGGGAYPIAGVIVGSDGNLYGTTYVGGSHYEGAVYRLDAAK